ncbi:MAG: hypothetical protein KBC32_10630 [Candidatus Didemnitutus sp.]|nr:hypothetical protein [Candidatus Didemnitutus sp.]
MNERVTFRILRDIFNILSYSSPDDLRSASYDQKLSPQIARALESLADEAAKGFRYVENRESFSRATRNPQPQLDPLERMIINSPRFADKKSIFDLAKTLGIKVSFGPKDSLARVQKRVIQAIRALPDGEKLAALRLLQGRHMKDLEGWLDVINRKG